MTLTAPRISAGFEPVRNLLIDSVPNPTKWRLTPNVAFKRGDMVALDNNMIVKATNASVAGLVGVMAASYSQADNPAASETYGLVYDHPFNVYRATFVDHRDAAATGGSTTTLIDTALGTSTDDVWNGALLYVYAGPAAGSVRTVVDYVGSSDTLTVAKPFPIAPTSSSSYILLGSGAAVGDAINKGAAGIVLKDEKLIDANANRLSSGALVGPLTCVGVRPADLMMDVIISLNRHHLG